MSENVSEYLGRRKRMAQVMGVIGVGGIAIITLILGVKFFILGVLGLLTLGCFGLCVHALWAYVRTGDKDGIGIGVAALACAVLFAWFSINVFKDHFQ